MQPELLALCFSLPEPIPEADTAHCRNGLNSSLRVSSPGAMAGRGLTAIA